MITNNRATGSLAGVYKKDSDKTVCPICKKEVEYLVGENTPDGGKMGCEECYVPSANTPTPTSEELSTVVGQQKI